jgi:hypothetical protein
MWIQHNSGRGLKFEVLSMPINNHYKEVRENWPGICRGFCITEYKECTPPPPVPPEPDFKTIQCYTEPVSGCRRLVTHQNHIILSVLPVGYRYQWIDSKLEVQKDMNYAH